MDGKMKRLLVHRKGATRAFPPHHPLIPVDYQLTGQPVLIGGTMGTCSYVLTGACPSYFVEQRLANCIQPETALHLPMISLAVLLSSRLSLG